MTVNVYDIKHFIVNLPSFDKNSFEKEVEETSGLRHEILKIEFNALLLLNSVTDKKASFERLAWFNIWTREIHLLDSALAAYEYKSGFLLEILGRLSFELQLQLFTILDPPFKKTEETNDSTIISRLRAFTAWCIWNDLYYIKDLSHKNTLENIWDPQPARDVMSDPDKYDDYKKYFGEIDIETDEKALRLGLFKQRDHAKHDEHRLKTWLNDKDLIEWKSILERKNYSPSFFSLFNESEQSVCKRLSKMGQRWMYIDYIHKSHIIHGSSLETNLFFHEKGFTPDTMKNEESVEDMTKSLFNTCMNVLRMLSYLQRHLW